MRETPNVDSTVAAGGDERGMNGGGYEEGCARRGECPRGADNDERVPTDFNYGICAGETLNFPAGTCPPSPATRPPTPAFSCALTSPPPPLALHPYISSPSPAISILLLALRVPAISISRHLSTTSLSSHRSLSLSPSLHLPIHPCPDRSLFNIDLLSKGRKYRESIELRAPHSRMSNPVVCSPL